MSNLEMEVVDGLDELCAEILENWNNSITHPPMPNPFYTNQTQSNEITKPNNETTEKSNDEQMISVLVADTFFDKWLGCGVNGVDLEALNAPPGNDLLNVLDDFEEGDFKLIVTDNDAEGINEEEVFSNPAAEKDVDNSIDENEAPPERNLFTLSSNKFIIDVDIESLENKEWRKDGAEMSDYFNFGMDEKKWIDYCKVIKKAIAEAKVDPRFYDSHFIIEIVPENNDSNRKMITGDKIKPFPIDYYNPAHDPDFSVTTNRPSNRNTFAQNGYRNTQGRHYNQRSYGNEMMSRMNIRGRQRDNTIRDNNQRNLKRVRFNLGNTNNNANPEQVKIVQEDPEKLKKRSERFQKVPEANATPDPPPKDIDTTANNKTPGPTNTSFPDEEIVAVNSDVYKERPVRKRKWSTNLNVVPYNHADD